VRALKLPFVGEGCVMNEPMITGCQPDSRNSTVRDERGGSGRQGHNPAGVSPVMSIARFRHVAIPHLGAGNQPSYAWCKRPGRPGAFELSEVGATWGSSEHGSLNIRECLQPRNQSPCGSCIAGFIWRAELVPPRARLTLSGKKRVEAPERRCGAGD